MHSYQNRNLTVELNMDLWFSCSMIFNPKASLSYTWHFSNQTSILIINVILNTSAFLY